jgi:hypothetical protein
MKILSLAAAAAIALSGLSAAPAMAQPERDWHGDRHDRGDRDMRHHDRGRHGGWDRGNHYGWNNHNRRNCRWVWRHHHRQRVCWR